MAAHTKTYQNPSITAATAVTLLDIGFTAAQIAGARVLYVTGIDGDLCYRMDGTDPTATYGHVIETRRTTELKEFSAIRLIGRTGTVVTTVELEHIS